MKKTFYKTNNINRNITPLIIIILNQIQFDKFLNFKFDNTSKIQFYFIAEGGGAAKDF